MVIVITSQDEQNNNNKFYKNIDCPIKVLNLKPGPQISITIPAL